MNNNDFPKRLNRKPFKRKILKIQIFIIIIPITNFAERQGMRIISGLEYYARYDTYKLVNI
ncbi:hypothetical protein C0J52_14130 [Blattella germanica]|nr:hypothetical protein C0J52_14130 [Blattella germanica]